MVSRSCLPLCSVLCVLFAARICCCVLWSLYASPSLAAAAPSFLPLHRCRCRSVQNQGNEFIPNIFQATLYMSMDPAVAQGTQFVTVVYGGAQPPVGESPAGHWNMLDEQTTVGNNPVFINGTLTCDRLGFGQGPHARIAALRMAAQRNQPIAPHLISSSLSRCTIGCAGVFTIAINPDGGASWSPMMIYFAKQCSWPSLSIGSYNADNNVMVHTVPVSTFSNYIVASTTSNNNFYVSLEDQQGDPNLTLQPFNLVIQSTNTQELTITPTGGLGWSDPRGARAQHAAALVVTA